MVRDVLPFVWELLWIWSAFSFPSSGGHLGFGPPKIASIDDMHVTLLAGRHRRCPIRRRRLGEKQIRRCFIVPFRATLINSSQATHRIHPEHHQNTPRTIPGKPHNTRTPPSRNLDERIGRPATIDLKALRDKTAREVLRTLPRTRG